MLVFHSFVPWLLIFFVSCIQTQNGLQVKPHMTIFSPEAMISLSLAHVHGLVLF